MNKNIKMNYIYKKIKRDVYPGSVLADNAQHFTLLYFQVDIAQCPDVVAFSFGGAIIQIIRIITNYTNYANETNFYE
jgi:hypothetical protein